MVFRDRAKDGTTRLTGLTLNDILLAAYPVGCVYTSVVNTDPSLLFGGVWARFGAGQVPVGWDSTQTEFDTVEETGGEKTHTLTTAEMPNHSHSSAGASAVVTTAASGGSGENGGGSLVQGAASGRFNHTFTLTFPNAANGGGGAHNNLQPYIVVYMWKRTA